MGSFSSTVTSCPPVTSVTTLLPDAVAFCGPGGVCFSLGILRGTVQSVASAVSGPGASCPGVSFTTLRPRLPMKEAGKKAAGPRPGAGVGGPTPERESPPIPPIPRDLPASAPGPLESRSCHMMPLPQDTHPHTPLNLERG